MKIAILTDSSYGGSLKDFKDLYQVPLMITEENGNGIPDDENLTEDYFYELLEKQALKTSLTTPKTMLEMWDKLLTEYDQIIFMSLSKGLSGQFATFRMLSETEDKYKGKVFVVDTNGVSIILQHLVRNVAVWIAENKTGFEIMELTLQKHNKFSAFIIPKNLETLKRGGRITPAAAALAKMLKITPILRYNGQIDKQGTARTFKKAVLEALELLKKEKKGIKEIDISYSKIQEETLELLKSLIAKEGFTINLEAKLPKVIASHTGPETVALVAWDKGE
ncbi:DegV family protein [Williamsoniiplasma lucivorax]|uniref:Fatty acid-binding protein DegV n=1 Tax=Williamsoniiplasma lucivorax TaxID=209274 RepID=A0A2S5RFZ4_9MOLU|nr:DegV family protein [Williamsoniiplasma lucivorax]PPE06132.1 fatty acid-binding protein DegV [Williamsoniiplasma lucivorax]